MIHVLLEQRKSLKSGFIPDREELEVEVRKFVNPNIGDEDDEPVSYTAKKESQPVTKSPKEDVKAKADIDPELAGMVDEDFLKSFQSL